MRISAISPNDSTHHRRHGSPLDGGLPAPARPRRTLRHDRRSAAPDPAGAALRRLGSGHAERSVDGHDRAPAEPGSRSPRRARRSGMRRAGDRLHVRPRGCRASGASCERRPDQRARSSSRSRGKSFDRPDALLRIQGDNTAIGQEKVGPNTVHLLLDPPRQTLHERRGQVIVVSIRDDIPDHRTAPIRRTDDLIEIGDHDSRFDLRSKTDSGLASHQCARERFRSEHSSTRIRGVERHSGALNPKGNGVSSSARIGIPRSAMKRYCAAYAPAIVSSNARSPSLTSWP